MGKLSCSWVYPVYKGYKMGTGFARFVFNSVIYNLILFIHILFIFIFIHILFSSLKDYLPLSTLQFLSYPCLINVINATALISHYRWRKIHVTYPAPTCPTPCHPVMGQHRVCDANWYKVVMKMDIYIYGPC